MKAKKNDSSKGFFFVLITLLILVYIVGSISLMIRALELSEKRAAEHFKVSNIELAIDQLTPEKMDKLGYIITYGALSGLNSHSVNHPVKPGDNAAGEWEFKYINKSMSELVASGFASGTNFIDGGELDLGEESSILGWAKNLNNSLNKVGLLVNSYSVSNFSVNQTNYSTIYYNFVLNATIGSKDGTASLTRSYKLNGSILLTGFVDPAIWREGKKKSANLEIKKQIFFHQNYPDSDSLEPKLMQKKGSAGQGWFYGPLITTATAGQVNETNRSKWILVGTYAQITELIGANLDYEQFGAFILTNNPTISGCGDESDTFNAFEYPGGDCTKKPDMNDQIDKPFAVIDGFSINSLPQDSTGCPDGKCVLFTAQYAPHQVDNDPKKKNHEVKVHGIESLRDFATCTYYTNNDRAPSYFQRLFDDSYKRNSSLGIETFLIGGFIGGNDPQTPAVWSDDVSRLDRELFNDNNVVDKAKIRGMAGCKNKYMCSGSSPVGHFTLGKQGREDYLGSQDISCKNGMANCD